MKKHIFCLCIALVCAACGKKQTVFESSGTPAEKWELIQDYLVPGATVSNECPLPTVLSEQEILLKAADNAIKEGLLDSSHFAYQQYPALLTAKIETPILVTDAENGEPNRYLLTAVNDGGELLAEVGVYSTVNTTDTDFFGIFGFTRANASNHFITKQEAAALIQSQFPDSAVSEPMAITSLRLDDDPYSHMFFYWYFTVNDTARSAADSSDEYIIASVIPGYTSIPGGVSNRAAIDYAGDRGDFHLKGYRMAKLDKPLRLFDKLETARSAGGASFAPSNYPAESVGITPVPLK
jgi:hypothetical protein